MSRALLKRVVDDLEVSVWPMTFGKARIVRGLGGEFYIDGAWCYADRDAAVAAASEWDAEGDPPGPWHRSVLDGRRREFDANRNVVREWVAP